MNHQDTHPSFHKQQSSVWGCWGAPPHFGDPQIPAPHGMGSATLCLLWWVGSAPRRVPSPRVAVGQRVHQVGPHEEESGVICYWYEQYWSQMTRMTRQLISVQHGLFILNPKVHPQAEKKQDTHTKQTTMREEMITNCQSSSEILESKDEAFILRDNRISLPRQFQFILKDIRKGIQKVEKERSGQ